MQITLDIKDIILTVSGTIIGFLSLSLSLLVYFHNRKSRVNQTFSLYLLSIGLWMLMGIFYVGTGIAAPQLVLCQMMASIWSGPLFYLFSKSLVHDRLHLKWYEWLIFLPVIWIVTNNIMVFLSPEKLAFYKENIYVADNTLHRFSDLTYEIYSFSLLVLHLIGLIYIGINIQEQKESALKQRMITILISMSCGFIFTFLLSSVMVLLGRPINVMLVFIPAVAGYLICSVSILQHKAWTVEYLIDIITEHRETLKDKIREITYLSERDYLTGIYNRRYFHHELEREQQLARRYSQQFGLIMFDIDHFKTINDQYGHDAGDEVLKKLTRVVLTNLRKTDIFARWGGEEFMILMPHADTDTLSALAEKLRSVIENEIFHTNLKVTCSFSALLVKSGDNYQQKLKAIDQALYEAKKSGRNCIKLDSSCP